MADVYRAFQFMNESLGLKIPLDKLAAMERQMKLQWGEEYGYREVRDPNEWEFFSQLIPRNKNVEPKFPPSSLKARPLTEK